MLEMLELSISREIKQNDLLLMGNGDVTVDMSAGGFFGEEVVLIAADN
jgi:hypothetical protein